jgi:hypothetical protein
MGRSASCSPVRSQIFAVRFQEAEATWFPSAAKRHARDQPALVEHFMRFRDQPPNLNLSLGRAHRNFVSLWTYRHREELFIGSKQFRDGRLILPSPQLNKS